MTLSLCNRNLTPLQRRSMAQMGGVGALAVLSNLSGSRALNPLTGAFPGLAQLAPGGHPSALTVGIVSAVSLLPVVVAVWVAARYLRAEPDDFIRTLVVRALLWGFAITVAADSLAGTLSVFDPRPLPLGILNADVFLISTAVAFRLSLRAYR